MRLEVEISFGDIIPKSHIDEMRKERLTRLQSACVLREDITMYHSAPLVSHADHLAHEIRQASAETRLKMQPKLGKVLQDLEQTGTAVPARLRNLHEQLLEEAIEAQFDNLPI